MGWEPEWDVGAIVEGVWQTGERTLFQGVQKVAPAGWVELGVDGELTKGTYWDLEYADKVRFVVVVVVVVVLWEGEQR
ncbi:hypothetical protein MYCTH_2297131, partial [Thermothelomyces thermophilus ATCC 42464]